MLMENGNNLNIKETQPDCQGNQDRNYQIEDLESLG